MCVCENIQIAVTHFLQKYEALSTKMLNMIKEFKFIFDNMSFKNKKYLNLIHIK